MDGNVVGEEVNQEEVLVPSLEDELHGLPTDEPLADDGPEEELAPEPEPEAGEVEEEETYEYTEGQVREMRKAFRVYDKVQNDTIPLSRLGCVLRSLGLNPKERQLRDAARWLGESIGAKGGIVRFKEFLIIMGRTLKEPVSHDQVLEGFRRLDEDKDGTVLRDRLHGVLTGTGESLYPAEFAAFIKHADPKKKGVVKYEEFVRRMNALAAAGGDGTKKKRKGKKGKKKGKKNKGTKKKREAGCDSSSSFSSEVLSIGQ